MRESPPSNVTRLVAALSCALAAGCSGSGGGGSAPAIQAATPAATSTATSQPTFCSGCVGPTSLGANSDTGIAAGTVAAPAPASFGAAARQTALPGGSTFDGSNGGYPANVTFPLIVTGLTAASSGLSAAANQDATLTVVSTTANSTNFQLVIPSLNLNLNFTNRENIVKNFDGATWGFSYVAAGLWGQRSGAGNDGPLQTFVAFSSGYETPAAAVPTTGTASFAGQANAFVFKPVNGTILDSYITGNASLSANFSSGQVTGALTQMQQWDGIPYGGTQNLPINYLPWNDVSLNANIAPGTNKFSGSTAVTSAPATAFSLAASATGHIDGALYGPAAQNVGAVWSLSDGTASAIGTLTGKQ